MTEVVPTDAGAAPAAAPSAGAQLRAAREAAGMSVDAVAQQLKLAPRQVTALEDGDFTRLPGRTFVRGFVRNYARLLRLDPEAVLGALPAAAAAPSLESPALHPTAPTMGELPVTEPARHGWTRWAIPLTLVAIVAATAAWEWLHPAADVRSGAAKEAAVARPATTVARESVGTPLPNPAATAGAATQAPAPAAPTPAAATEPPTPTIAETRPVPESPPAPQAAGPGAPLELGFRDYSWTEIKERGGRVLLSKMNPGGTTQAVSGAPPLDVVIGNAADVTLTWKGKRVDLAPHTRQNVARLTLE